MYRNQLLEDVKHQQPSASYRSTSTKTAPPPSSFTVTPRVFEPPVCTSTVNVTSFSCLLWRSTAQPLLPAVLPTEVSFAPPLLLPECVPPLLPELCLLRPLSPLSLPKRLTDMSSRLAMLTAPVGFGVWEYVCRTDRMRTTEQKKHT